VHDLNCRTARLLLQASADLNVLDGRRLERHLVSCSECEAYRRRQASLDDLIRHSLTAATQGVSVRAQVRARLASPPAKRRRGFPVPLKPLWAAIPTAVAAVLVIALVLPRFSGSQQSAPPVSATRFKAKRTGISYPLTVDPSRPNHILVGGGGQVYESWNAGRTFHRLAALPGGLVVRDLAIDATNPGRYVVAALHSILVSDDAGKSWHVTAEGLLGAENIFLTQQPSTPAAFFVGPSILWKSSNHGQTWAPAGPGRIFGSAGAAGIQALAFAPDGTLYTAIWDGGIAVSHDGGLTWLRRSRGLPRKVLDVTLGPSGTLWAAATDAGVYRSENGGRTWHHVGPPMHLYTTGIIDRGSYVLAGGNGGVFRSTDGGRHWTIADDGLPLAAYVFGFVADPRNPQRVYVSLDDDGVFRSDDGGMHWVSAQGNIPVTAGGSSPLIVFRRDGQVWQTDPNGADPGNLTVDTHVAAAAVSPDGASVAYTTGEGDSWWLRVVQSGGSAARTLLTGTGPTPRHILWSHDATITGVVDGRAVRTVTVNGRGGASWLLPSGGLILGISPGGEGLLTWSANEGVRVRAWTNGRPLTRLPGSYRVPPAVSSDGSRVALVIGGRLLVGSWGGLHGVAAVPPRCTAIQWSDDGSRLLLSCAHEVQERTALGARVALIHAISASAFWVPGSDSDLLFYRQGSLWRWSPGGARLIVGNAHDVRGYHPAVGTRGSIGATPTAAR
jgi:photosystem II stability/assembly factor-like uncharacterized protein